MIALMNKQYGLDKPVWQQYLTYLWNILHGDFGTSYQSINQPVGRLISQRLGVSIQLGVQALIVGFLSGIVVGAASARNKITGLMVYLVLFLHLVFQYHHLLSVFSYWLLLVSNGACSHLQDGVHLNKPLCHLLPWQSQSLLKLHVSSVDK